VDFDKDRWWFRTFCNPFEASYENDEPTLQLELIGLHRGDGLRPKFKAKGDLLNLKMCLPEDKYPNLRQKAAVCASLFGGTYMCEQASSLVKLNKWEHGTG